MTIYEGQQFFADADFPFYIDRYTIKRGELIPPHAHNFVEFVYVVSGSGLHEKLSLHSSPHIKINPSPNYDNSSYRNRNSKNAVLFSRSPFWCSLIRYLD